MNHRLLNKITKLNICNLKDIPTYDNMLWNICYLECLEITPNYRGKEIGKKVIKNMMERFYDSCGLWLAKAFPIQHSGIIQKTAFENLDQWDQ